MNNMVKNLIVVTAFSFSIAANAAEEVAGKEAAAPQPVAASAVQPAPAAAPALAPVQKPEASPVRSTAGKPAKARGVRSKSLDLRHCLDLDSNAAIAKCAGE